MIMGEQAGEYVGCFALAYHAKQSLGRIQEIEDCLLLAEKGQEQVQVVLWTVIIVL